MSITPPLSPDDEGLNDLANRFARELASAFGYALPEAEEHVRHFFLEYEASRPEARRILLEKGVDTEPMTTAEVFFHDDSALVLEIGYRLAGGDASSLEFLDWRKDCWDGFKTGQRVPKPHFYEAALIERVRAMSAAKAKPAEVISVMLETIPPEVSAERVPVLLKVAFPELGYDVIRDIGAAIGKNFWKARVNTMLWWWR